jgi:hypothetical protein
MAYLQQVYKGLTLMRVRVDVLGRRVVVSSNVTGFSKLSSLLTYPSNARPSGRAFPALRRMGATQREPTPSTLTLAAEKSLTRPLPLREI